MYFPLAEATAVEKFRIERRIPSLSVAVRHLVRLGLGEPDDATRPSGPAEQPDDRQRDGPTAGSDPAGQPPLRGNETRRQASSAAEAMAQPEN